MVWNIVADLQGETAPPPLARAVEVLSGAGLGLRRRLQSRDGGQWEEACISWEPEQRYMMEHVAGEFPVPATRLRYTCSVTEESAGVLIRLYFDYQPRFGVLSRVFERLGLQRQLEDYARDMLDNWIRIIHAREWAYRVTARSILEEKGGHVHALAPSAPVSELVSLLQQYRIGSALVVDPQGQIAGVVSERDVVRALADVGNPVLERPVATIMTTEVITAAPESNMMTVMACMSERRIRHLPVVEGDQVLGLISIGDVIKARMSELEGQSESLRDYIEARRWHEAYKEMGPAAYADD
jgi:CBS domain-containing protein